MIEGTSGCNAVKYQVRLDDGAIIATTPEEGVEFHVKDGNYPSMNRTPFFYWFEFICKGTLLTFVFCFSFLFCRKFCMFASFRSFLSSTAKSTENHEKGREGQSYYSTSMYVFPSLSYLVVELYIGDIKIQ